MHQKSTASQKTTQRKTGNKREKSETDDNENLLRAAAEYKRREVAFLEKFTKEIESEFNVHTNKDFIINEKTNVSSLNAKLSNGALVKLLKIVDDKGELARVDVVHLSSRKTYSHMSYYIKTDHFIFNRQSAEKPIKILSTTFDDAVTLFPSLMKDFREGEKQKFVLKM